MTAKEWLVRIYALWNKRLHLKPSTDITSDFKAIKERLLVFGKSHHACGSQYGRLYASTDMESLMAIVKDNFAWCCQFDDFADVIVANRERFANHKIWVNESIEISEGNGYLLLTDGVHNATSGENSTINAESWGSSTINAESWGSSTIKATSRGSSTINATSRETSTINAESRESSTINAESWGSSTINAESWGSSTINATSWESSTINATSWESSTINATSWESSTIKATSRETSTINATSRESSTIKATSRETSTINAESRENSTIIVLSPSIKCRVNDSSIARYILENRIIFSDDKMRFERYT